MHFVCLWLHRTVIWHKEKRIFIGVLFSDSFAISLYRVCMNAWNEIKQRMRERNKSIRSSTSALRLFFYVIVVLLIDGSLTACHGVLLNYKHVETHVNLTHQTCESPWFVKQSVRHTRWCTHVSLCRTILMIGCLPVFIKSTARSLKRANRCTHKRYFHNLKNYEWRFSPSWKPINSFMK